ncbi:MAG: hypothetical protein IPL75_16105 [Acidobacteria bacterium]|nr:hypothetical protein [Acidobacteriota bacterium]
MRFGLRSNDPSALTEATRHAPLGWQSSPMEVVDILYSLRVAAPSPRRGQRNFNLLYCGSGLIARSFDLAPLFTAFHRHAELLTALRAQNCVFLHAGVVGWRGRALIIPGRSMTGKTTLVSALVRAGAGIYSDEFAVLDKAGQVHPYPVPLSVRGTAGEPGVRTPVESLGGQAGTGPLPLGLIVVTRYAPTATWCPLPLSPAVALLACMDNAVAAQREPESTMPILRRLCLAPMQSKANAVRRTSSRPCCCKSSTADSPMKNVREVLGGPDVVRDWLMTASLAQGDEAVRAWRQWSDAAGLPPRALESRRVGCHWSRVSRDLVHLRRMTSSCDGRAVRRGPATNSSSDRPGPALTPPSRRIRTVLKGRRALTLASTPIAGRGRLATVDALIEPTSIDAARPILAELGWTCPHTPGALARTRPAQFQLLVARRRRPDIHHVLEGTWPGVDAGLWRRTVSIEDDQTRWLVQSLPINCCTSASTA